MKYVPKLLNLVILAIFGAILAVFILLGTAYLASAKIPSEAKQYRNTLIREAHYYFGLQAPISIFAAQIHTESLWQKKAISPANAKGLTQFIPSTAKWIPEIDSRLKNPDPFNPKWAIRALCSYNKWHYNKITADTELDKWAFALAAYNGGLGWVNRDKKLAEKLGYNPNLYFDNVELVNAGRAGWAIKENRLYPKRILFDIRPYYRDWDRVN